jgi:hypothetical protein
MNKRTVHVMNCDPAAEDLQYSPSIDIRELISLEDVEEELDYGPNGTFCLSQRSLRIALARDSKTQTTVANNQHRHLLTMLFSQNRWSCVLYRVFGPEFGLA